MNTCKICNTDCSWSFCDDCSKLIGQGVGELQSRARELEAENGRYVEALKHYADRKRWFLGPMGFEFTTYHNEADRKIRHGYLVAQEALKGERE